MAIESLETKKERYAAYRLEGYGDGEAAERAGYESKAPKGARDLHSKAESTSGDHLAMQKRTAKQEIARLEFELERAKQRLRAVKVNRALRGDRDS